MAKDIKDIKDPNSVGYKLYLKPGEQAKENLKKKALQEVKKKINRHNKNTEEGKDT